MTYASSMRHRTLTALICLPALAAVLTGCSGDDTTPAATSTSTSSATATTAATTTAPPPSEPDPTRGEVAPDPAPAPSPEPAPVPAPAPAPVVTGPQLGDQCIGADIGRTAVAADGTAIMCDNYVWQLNQGQTPSHPWVDGQREWAECVENATTEECRETLTP
jgi:hypothetical protein